MDNKKSAKLIIISLPFYRIARVTLSEIVLHFLLSQKDTEILVVCPFANEPGFQKSFKDDRLQFRELNFSSLNRLKFLLLGVTEMLRRNGYWRRFRHSGFSYYLRNQYITFKPINFLQNLGLFPKYWNNKFIN